MGKVSCFLLLGGGCGFGFLYFSFGFRSYGFLFFWFRFLFVKWDDRVGGFLKVIVGGLRMRFSRRRDLWG